MKNMKKIATTLFVLALLGSILAWPYRLTFWGGLAFATFGAAMVGALADWFAVVALFRHPLGLKFVPHTAIIPENRERIIDTITDLVENQWLNLDIIKTKIDDFPILECLSQVLSSADGQQRLESFLASAVTNIINSVSTEQAVTFIHNLLREQFTEIKIPPETALKLESSLKNIYSDDIIDFFIDRAIAAVESPNFHHIVNTVLQRAVEDYSSKGGWLRRLGKGLGESLDIINYQQAATSVVQQSRELLRRMKTSYNPYRVSIKAALDGFHVSDSETLSKTATALLQKAISSQDGTRIIQQALCLLKEHLLTENLEKYPMVQHLARLVTERLNVLNTDAEKKQQVEGWIKAEANSIAARYHQLIGIMVRENLQALNDEGFVESLEDKVGNDLQWIRVNGTVIGALVGMAEYLILHLIK